MTDFFARFDWNQNTRDAWFFDEGRLPDDDELDTKAHEVLTEAVRTQNADLDPSTMPQQHLRIKDQLVAENSIVLDFVVHLETFNSYVAKTRETLDQFARDMNGYNANPNEQPYSETREMQQFRTELSSVANTLNDIYKWANDENPGMQRNFNFSDYVTHLFDITVDVTDMVRIITTNERDNRFRRMSQFNQNLAIGFQEYHSILVNSSTPFITEIMQRDSFVFLFTSLNMLYNRMVSDQRLGGLGIYLDGPRLPTVV